MRAIDNAVVEGMKAYLKRCSNGGMPQNQIDLILEHVNAAADLQYFSISTMEHSRTLLDIISRGHE